MEIGLDFCRVGIAGDDVTGTFVSDGVGDFDAVDGFGFEDGRDKVRVGAIAFVELGAATGYLFDTLK